MSDLTFFERRTFGLQNYLLLAMVMLLCLAFVPRGVRKALESNTNQAEDWLPPTYAESIDLRWFRKHFVGEQFALVSWQGCTLGDDQRLKLLADKLRREPLQEGSTEKLFTRIVTGPEMLAALGQPPAQLERNESISRLEGALVGPPAIDAQGRSLGDASRTTCLVAYLGSAVTKNNKTMRRAVERIAEIAHSECNIELSELHMGGPPVDNTTIDVESERTLQRLSLLSGAVGLGVSYWCFGSIAATLLVFFVGVASAGMSIACVYYYGVFEVLVLGQPEPFYGRLDAIVMSMPAVVYVLGLSGAVHLVNYYTDTRMAEGIRGAVERSVMMSWLPCFLAAFTTAQGLASLGISDILPIRKFGLFTGVATVATIAILFTAVPIVLFRFPNVGKPAANRRSGPGLPPWGQRASRWVIGHSGLVVGTAFLLMGITAFGTARIQSSVQLLKLLHPSCDLITDYAWLEQHLGNLVPVEFLVAIPPELRREPDQRPEGNGQGYQLAMFERVELIQRLQERIEALAPVSRTLSVATFAPVPPNDLSPTMLRTHAFTVSEALEKFRGGLREYLTWEQGDPNLPSECRREIWRISSRITAMADVDYGLFVHDMRAAVVDVLDTYNWRSELVRRLAAEGEGLAGSRVCLVFDGDAAAREPAANSREALLTQLLREAGVSLRVGGRQGKLSLVSTDNLAQMADKLLPALETQHAIVVTTPASRAAIEKLAAPGLKVVDLSGLLINPADQIDVVTSAHPAADTAPRLATVFTGVVPVVYKTQRQLLTSLGESIVLATLMITVVMALVMRSFVAGLIAMIPNLFPLILVFGTIGWLGIKVDIGTMMAAGVALGVAVDNTIHYTGYFRRGLAAGLSRPEAASAAHYHCGRAMLQSTAIGGVGLAVFSASTFTPTQQFGILMMVILSVGLVGDLVLLPALLVSPLGKWFVVPVGAAGFPLPQHVAVPAASAIADVPAESPVETQEVAPTSPIAGLLAVEPSPQRRHDSAESSPATLSLREKLRRLRRDAAHD